PELKADWRGVATEGASRSDGPTLVIVAPPGPGPNVEVETARDYLPAHCDAIALDEATAERLEHTPAHTIYLAVGSREGFPVIAPPERIGAFRFHPDRGYPGLTTLRAEHRTARGGLGFGGGRFSRSADGRGVRIHAGGRVAIADRLEDGEHQAVKVTVEVGSG